MARSHSRLKAAYRPRAARARTRFGKPSSRQNLARARPARRARAARAVSIVNAIVKVYRNARDTYTLRDKLCLPARFAGQDNELLANCSVFSLEPARHLNRERITNKTRVGHPTIARSSSTWVSSSPRMRFSAGTTGISRCDCRCHGRHADRASLRRRRGGPIQLSCTTGYPTDGKLHEAILGVGV